MISDRDRAALADLDRRQKKGAKQKEAFEELFCEEAVSLLCENTVSDDTEEYKEGIDRLCEDYPDVRRYRIVLQLLITHGEAFLKRSAAMAVLPAKPKICLPDNSYAREAADASGLLAEFVYAGSFEDAADLAGSGETDGCLMPFLDENGREMQGLMRYVSANGLYKTAVFRIVNERQNCFYGLFTKKQTISDGAEYADVLLCPENSGQIKEAVLLLDEMKIEHSLPFSRGEQGKSALNAETPCRLTLHGQMKELQMALIGLSLLVRETSVGGFYYEKECGENLS